MRQMKKKIIIAIIVTLLLTATFAFIIGHFVIKGKEEEIQQLQQEVVDTECLAFARDLKADSIITHDDIKQVKIKMANISSGTYVVTGSNVYHHTKVIDANGNENISQIKINKEDLIGRVVKSNVSKNTLILDSLLYAEEDDPTKDERIQEFNFLQLPSDLVENDYIDVRIQFPAGEDYSVLIGKKIEKIAGENTIFIKMNEEEIMAMGSAIIEAYMQTGVRLYAIKYTDPATQLFNEEIVDYVAKYEDAVEKLIKEKQEIALRKAVANNFIKDGMYTAHPADYVEEDEIIAGIARVTVATGEMLNASGEVIRDTKTIEIKIAKNDDNELLVSSKSWNEVTQEIKDEVLKKNPEINSISVNDFETELLAKYAKIEEEYIKDIKMASINNDENILNFYRVMRVQTRDEIIRTYPVKVEVLDVIKNNPNLLDTIIAEFDEVALLNTRIDEYQALKAEYETKKAEYNRADEYNKMLIAQELTTIEQEMNSIVNTRVQNVEQKLKEEIEAQKAERINYLDSLING